VVGQWLGEADGKGRFECCEVWVGAWQGNGCGLAVRTEWIETSEKVEIVEVGVSEEGIGTVRFFGSLIHPVWEQVCPNDKLRQR
jgi:hypothetical protein